jgi:N-acetylglucosaminyl-diphospho-decaprenol L-rhamnosyltransferase
MLSVIIVSWNVRDLLRKCLRSLLDDLEHSHIQARVLVFDNASQDGSPAMVRQEFPTVELIACVENLGFVQANNQALEQLGIIGATSIAKSIDHTPGSKNEFVWLLNSDAEVCRGAARSLIDFMQAHPRCSLCGPKLMNPDNSLQHGAFAFPGLVQLLLETQPLFWRFRGTRLDGRYSTANYEAGVPFEIGHPLGAAMMARVAAIQQVGGLDQGYEMYAEEVDWAMRMKLAGWERWCVPSAVVVHYGGASSSQAKERTERVKWRSRMRYYAKYYSPVKCWLALQFVPRRFRNDVN